MKYLTRVICARRKREEEKIHNTRGRAEALAHRRAYALTGCTARENTSHPHPPPLSLHR